MDIPFFRKKKKSLYEQNRETWKQIFVGKEKRDIALWSGVVESAGTRSQYLLRSRHLRAIIGQETVPRLEKQANTHDFHCWREVERKQQLLFHFQVDLGSHLLENFKTTTQQWRSPDEYNFSLKRVDDCAKTVTFGLVDKLCCAPYEKLMHGQESNKYWFMTIEDLMLECPNLRPKLDLKKDIRYNRNRAQIYREDD